MAGKTITTDEQGIVLQVEDAPVLPPTVAEEVAQIPPGELEARRLKALKERRTAIITGALERRRQARDAERAAAIALSREQAGTAESQIENGWVKASDVIVPPEYQRIYVKERSEGYAMKFSWRKFRSIAVNRRPDGTKALVDGQHRLRGAQMVFGDDVLVPCTFTDAETTKEEAGDFTGINDDRYGLAYNASFRARVHNEDEDAMRVLLTLEEFGLRPLWPGEQRGLAGTVTACRTLEYQVKQAGASSARAVLSILKELWGEDPEAYRDFILGGLWQFLLRYDGYVRRDRILLVLGNLKTPKDMDDLTAEHRAKVNASPAVACCGAIHFLYNYKMKLADALPPYAPESSHRQSAIIRRHARRWNMAHEAGKGGAKRAGLWSPGGQLPHLARKRDHSPG